MKLKEHLQNKRSRILSGWVDCIVESYPPETAMFLRNKKDRFANPVGHAIFSETENLFNQLVGGMKKEEASQFLDRLIRIRAIQDFSPGEALGFVFQLKDIVRRSLADELAAGGLEEEILALEAAIDQLAMLAFEIYVGCREQIYEVRVKEHQRNSYMLLRRAGLLVEKPDQEPDSQDANHDRQN